MNELLLIISLLVSFGATFVFMCLFGKAGLYAWIAISAILANIEVTVLVNAFGMEQTLGNTLFYGKKDADRGVYIGIITTVMFIVFSLLWTNYIPSENDWAMPSIKSLFSSTPRILISSLAGYAISEKLDVWLYHKWWNLTEKKTGDHNKFLWFRNNFSTLISQFINIVVFNFGAFYGTLPFATLVEITGACYVIYIVTSLLDTPFVYLARKFAKKD